VQGYRLSRPVPAAEMAAQLRGNAVALRRLQIVAAAGAPSPRSSAVAEAEARSA
jgi:hypothetical protein